MRQQTTGSEEEENLKESLSGLSKKYFNQPDNTARVVPLVKKRKWLFAAAAVIFILLAGAYWVFFTGSKDNEELYAQYAVHQLLSLQRGNKDTIKVLQDAVTAYNSGKFNQALTGLTRYLQTDSSDAELVLAEKICLIETGNYEQAIMGLNKIEAGNDIFRFQAIWYKALAYLKQNNKAECKKILASIPANADTYSKAKNLLKEL